MKLVTNEKVNEDRFSFIPLKKSYQLKEKVIENLTNWTALNSG